MGNRIAALRILAIVSILFLMGLNPSSQTSHLSYATVQVPSIVAEGAILIDGDTGQVLYEKNAHKRFYPASITKLMTALVASKALDPSDTITFSRNAVLSIEFGSSHIGMREGEIISVKAAMHGLLMASANDVANGIAEKTSGSLEAFAEDMTAEAKNLGAMNTNFVNPHGLQDENQYTTAYDMSLIMKEILENQFLVDVMGKTLYEILPTNKVDEIRYLAQGHKMINERRDANIYREDVIAGKTGYTTSSGHTLVTVSRKEGRTLIAVTLRTNAANLYSDTSKLFEYGYKAFEVTEIDPTDYTQALPIIEKGVIIGTATLSMTEPVSVNLRKDYSEVDFLLEVDLPEALTREASLNQKVGSLIISIGDRALGEWPLEIIELEYEDLEDQAREETEVEKKLSMVEVIKFIILIATIVIVTKTSTFGKFH
ncbi:D-alanyl-D-alanine carboxypeptidase family protein [Petrocella sp. FN5]|uniref:D-alanyl-D-alanine carboxypeptidase family protein n=1 Tax=Petrocella sp. FN5 TaxID=3032002 RepID=UPI0023DC5278|nr:D-alanyl-D-alanine carboxypeptidase family protein [Petrocella sp. FN5]MDF1618439.1 D-alanyl-D-alanine carboxypeptidase [Petrocella sp. FN5]